jgi:polyhydroxyalkanoate synthesis regulator phasin
MLGIREFVEKLIRNTKDAEAVIDEWIDGALKRFKLPTRSDLEVLEQKISELENKINQLELKQDEIKQEAAFKGPELK